MEFTFSEEQETFRKLAQKVCADKRAAGEALSGELGKAGLLGVAVPQESGGAGLGLVELALVLGEAGKVAAPIALPASIVGAMTLGRFGTEAQRAHLPAALAGERLIAPALTELGGQPERPATRATQEGAGFRLTGEKVAVPGVAQAARLIVPARLPAESGGAPALFLVDPAADGVRKDRQVGTDDGELHAVQLKAAPAELLARGAEALAWLYERVSLAYAALELGVATRQLEMTAEHVLRRQQFGKPIGMFQAVAQRAADMYIDVESMRLTLWQAAFLLDEARETGRSVSAEVAIAAFWAAEAGARVAVASQHLHGGIGFDRGYPLYRYFLVAKSLELQLGGATRRLAELGALLAREPAEEGFEMEVRP